ncbi:MAG TPA: hypothetical protein IAC14_01675 [Candidatus Scybalomonas excrementigallinarum]|nr:hypothetical protein [Candidatus Scybalomonas excrementigallinarum]
MFVDERIALLERYQRQLKREEEGKKEEKKEELLTIEQAKQGIEKGVITLFDGREIEIEKKIYFKQQIQVPILKNFYDAHEEDGTSAVYVNHEHEISQILTYLDENMQEIPLEDWKKVLVNGMIASGLYADVIKAEQTESLEYICFLVPSKKGDIYNIVFRMRGQERKFTGNFNCMKKEQDPYGTILEAMVLKIGEWMLEKEGEAIE